jgi:uncharacterized protein (DUF2141 family)
MLQTCSALDPSRMIANAPPALSVLMKRGWVILVTLGLLCAGLAPAAQAQGTGARLTIHVQGVLAKGGLVRLGVYDRAAYDKEGEPVAFADVAAKADETVITLGGIAPGDYAIETYQDVNANDKMDQSLIGLPQEPYGFSRNARPFLSKPHFDAVKFTVAPGENVQTVRLRGGQEK